MRVTSLGQLQALLKINKIGVEDYYKAKGAIQSTGAAYVSLLKIRLSKELTPPDGQLYPKENISAYSPAIISEETKKGVVFTIYRLIVEAGSEGITKEELLQELVDIFPTRSRKGLRSSLTAALTYLKYFVYLQQERQKVLTYKTGLYGSSKSIPS